jgi:ecdysteroid kinase
MPNQRRTSIPGTMSAIDSTWLSEVIGRPVVDFSVTQIGQGVGIMGDIYRVTLTHGQASSGPSSVVVKLPSSFEENRAQGVALGMFEAEVRFYNELAHQAPVGVPKVYLADIATGTADFVIVMEDLSAYALVAQESGMTAAQAHAAVRVLASIHATWWNNVQNPDLEWIPSMIGPRIELVDQILPGIFPAFAEGFAKYLPSGGLEIFETFTGNYMKINRVLAERSPWTLVHQDFRVENLLFGTDTDNTVMVLDWQGIGRGPGAYDLAYLLGGSMRETLRQSHEQDLVRTYHQSLQQYGVADYSLEQCQDDYALAHLMGGLATPILLGGAMDLSNARGVTLVATMAARHARAAIDHDGLNRLKTIV